MAFDPMSAGLSAGTSLISGALGQYASGRAASAVKKQNQRAQAIQQRNLLMNLGMYEPNRALGYGAMSDLASLYGYALPQYQSQSDLARTTTPLSPKLIKQYIKSGMSLDQIAQMGTLATPNAKQMKKLRKAGLTADQIQSLMTPTQQSTYQGPLQGGTDTGDPAAGNMSRFFTSPDYQFRLNEGQRNIGNSFAARGGAASGNALRALTDYNQNMASGEYGNYVNRLFQMAGIGQQAQGQVSGVGTNTANNNSQLQQGIGQANASGIMGAANSWANALGSGLNNYFQGSYLNSMNGSGVQGNGLSPIDITAGYIHPSTYTPTLGY